MKIFGFTITKQEKIRETKSIEVWTVSWYSRHGAYSHNTKRQFVPFFNAQDAEDFKKSLVDAHKLLRNTNYINIKINRSNKGQ